MDDLWTLELQGIGHQEREKLEQAACRGALALAPLTGGGVRLCAPRELLAAIVAQESLAPYLRYFARSALPRASQNKERQQQFWLIAGPCAAESLEQLRACARALQSQQIPWMRAGLFKPRTSPYAFQGHGALAAQWMRQIKEEFGLKLVSEIREARELESSLDVIDMIQVGARNMHNGCLLKTVAQTGRPILLKRGWSATYQEWLAAAEYLLCSGAEQVLLCERGIRTFETYTRFTLDINAVAVMKELTHLPILVDPSHATGQRRWVMAAARAAVAAGADGLLVEIHPDPDRALCDAEQALPLEELEELCQLSKWRLANR